MKKELIASFKVLKDETASKMQIVYSEVYAPMLPDSDNEFMDEAGVMEMAHNFMRSLRLKNCDVQHNNVCVDGACIVESFIARKGDPDFIAGAWVIGMHVPDARVWKQIENHEINGFSLEALVRQIPCVIEIEVPDVIEGTTMKSEDGHVHKFYVSYDDNGKFQGGYTDTVDGHMHLIRGGSVTEKAANHAHRYSYLDALK